ncbi:hypothetical protein DB30_04261 [Enhygromyxa salina]|uniref:Uncharacterized protein n=1 Tax=Enhygromyxa salina TaxID=215803 RepID=A0A0C2D9G3_9BACT|nr:hypothetical protein DB30_04261 [Enhygromyxa salina]
MDSLARWHGAQDAVRIELAGDQSPRSGSNKLVLERRAGAKAPR